MYYVFTVFTCSTVRGESYDASRKRNKLEAPDTLHTSASENPQPHPYHQTAATTSAA